MNSSKNLSTDLICIGETLIDFIGTQIEASISETKDYHRYLGGFTNQCRHEHGTIRHECSDDL